MRGGRCNRSKGRSTARVFSRSVYQAGSYMLSNRQEVEMSSARAERGCSCHDIWGSSLCCATWWMNRPLCVLGEISGDAVLIITCINVLRIGEDLGGCTVYLALLKQCQEDPYGRMRESPTSLYGVATLGEVLLGCTGDAQLWHGTHATGLEHSWDPLERQGSSTGKAAPTVGATHHSLPALIRVQFPLFRSDSA